MDISEISKMFSNHTGRNFNKGLRCFYKIRLHQLHFIHFNCLDDCPDDTKRT